MVFTAGMKVKITERGKFLGVLSGTVAVTPKQSRHVLVRADGRKGEYYYPQIFWEPVKHSSMGDCVVHWAPGWP